MSTEQELPGHVSRLKNWSEGRKINSENVPAGKYRLDYDFGVSIAYKMMIVEPRNMSTEHKLPRHVSRLKTWAERRKMDSEITYG